MFRDIPSLNVGAVKSRTWWHFVLLHRNGLVEQENELEVPFGTDRLLGLLAHHHGQSLEAVHLAIISALDAFKGTEPALDDTAMLSCRFDV